MASTQEGWLYGLGNRKVHYYVSVDPSQAPTRLCDTTRHTKMGLTPSAPAKEFCCERCATKLAIRAGRVKKPPRLIEAQANSLGNTVIGDTDYLSVDSPPPPASTPPDPYAEEKALLNRINELAATALANLDKRDAVWADRAIPVVAALLFCPNDDPTCDQCRTAATEIVRALNAMEDV